MILTVAQDCSQINTALASQPYLQVENGLTLNHQAIIPSYRPDCNGTSGIINNWAIYVNYQPPEDKRRRKRDTSSELSFNLQVWRPFNNLIDSPCYSLVGNHSNTVRLCAGLSKIAPPQRSNLPFLPGDVLGFHVETVASTDGDQSDNGNQGQPELTLNSPSELAGEMLLYRANIAPSVTVVTSDGNGNCPLSAGSSEILDTSTQAVLFISSE